MDPNPTNFPILSYVMQKFPSFTRTFSTSPAADFDIENPRLPDPEPSEPHFELSEKMPHLKNPKLISSMRRAVSDVAQTRSVLKAIGPRPDHETLDLARSRVSVVESRGSGVVDKDYKTYKAVMALDEMHEAYGRMLSEAERRLERIYEAALAGVDVAEEMEEEEAKVVEMNEEVAAILKEAEMGKKAVERADLSGRQLRILPEAFGRINSLIVLNLSNNQLQVIPDSIARLENLEELNLSLNFLDSLPDSIGLLLKLKFLDVSHNKLVNLPDSIAHCRSLEELDASYNKLTYLPTNLGFELVNLKRLSIQLNKLRSLPTSVGEMKSLRLLDVHFNELRSLPYSIGNLTNLEILNLSSNFSDLTQLPDTISQLTNLRELDLSHNQIHALPDTFGELMNLTKLNLDENPIEVPPKRVADMGAEAVKKYMTKRWLDIQMEVEEKRNMIGGKEDEDGGLLTRSTSWLKSVVSTLGSMGKSDADRYLNQEF